MKTTAKRGPRFGFDLGPYEEVRSAGGAAYEKFIGALIRDGFFDEPKKSSEVSSESMAGPTSPRALSGGMPIFFVSFLPLRTLVCLGASAAEGLLRRFEQEPMEPDAEAPASQDLRAWYLEHRDDFRRFFPEQHGLGLPDEKDWLDPSEEGGVWRQVERVSAAIARATGGSHGCGAGLYALLRDEVKSLEGPAALLGVDFAPLAEAAFGELSGGGSIEPVKRTYETLAKDADLPDSATLAFAAFMMSGESDLISELRGRWSENDLIAVARGRSNPSYWRVRGLNVTRRAMNDLPAEEDGLGMAPLVQGMRRLLDDEETELPLAIGLDGQWGSGKSSVMLQLRKALLQQTDGARTWIPVDFDAWKYANGDQLWVALAKAIYEQAEVLWSPWEWARFKLRVEIRRRGRRDLVLRLAAFVALAVFSLAAVMLQGVEPPAIVGSLLLVAGLSETVGYSWGAMADPLKRAFDAYSKRPSQGSAPGLTSQANLDIQVMTEELTARGNRAIAVFVDDLDRCSPRHIVDVVESINQIFNSNARAQCVFVVGMDRDMVTAGIESAYADTIEKLPPERRRNFGISFLDKVIQLMVSLPIPEHDEILRMISSRPYGRQTSMRAIAAQRRRMAIRKPASPDEVRDAANRENGERSLKRRRFDLDEAVRVERARLVERDSTDVWDVERAVSGYLNANPRLIKRFDTAFRLQLHIATEAIGADLIFDRVELVILGKLIALRLGWPDLADAIDRDRTLLKRLEELSNADFVPGSWPLALPEIDDDGWLRDRRLVDLLRGQRTVRISRLTGKTFLRVF